MSEVYIRSQNKEKLYRLGGNYACVEYGEYEDIKKKRDCLAFICIRAMTLQPQIPRVTHPAYFQEILIMSTSRNIQPV